MVPLYGIRFVFFLFIFILIVRGCPPDTFQLINFILTFKGTQVISSGVVMSIIAAYRYYLCVHPNGFHTCDVNGPGSSTNLGRGGVLDFLGSCFLVWAAFLCLPCSNSSAGVREILPEEEDDGYTSDGTLASRFQRSVGSDSGSESGKTESFNSWCLRNCKCCRTRNAKAGGRMTMLLCWDLFSFFLCCAFLWALCYVDDTDSRPGGLPANRYPINGVGDVSDTVIKDFGTWEFKIAFFFTRVFYAYLSLPFVIFMLPLLNGILTHTTPTGYNRQGLCVPYMLPPMPKREVPRSAWSGPKFGGW